MSKSPTHRTSAGEYDGGSPQDYQSGLITFGASAGAGPVDVALSNLTVARALLIVKTTPTDATALVNFGTEADSTKFLNGYVAQNLAAGIYDITESAKWDSKDIAYGDLLEATFGIGAAGGEVALALVLMPRGV